MEETINNEITYFVENMNSFCSSVGIFDPTPNNQTISLKEIESGYCESMSFEQQDEQ
jgi:hypothetical protein